MSQDSQPSDGAGSSADATRSALVACLLDADDLDRRAEELRLADVLEVRADRVGDLDVEALRARFDGKLLYTLRSVSEGGVFDGDAAERARRLTAAARSFDLVDIELETDGDRPELLAEIQARQRVVSWHGRFGERVERSALVDLARRQRAIEAAHSKIIVAAAAPGDAMTSLELLTSELDSGPRDRGVTVFAMGEAGSWTRPLAARLGSALTFAALGEEAAAGQIPLARLVRDYGLDQAAPRPTRLCGVVGWPVAHSLSPRLHNGAYAEVGLADSMFLAFAAESFDAFWKLVRDGRFAELGLEIGGFAVTTPHKEAAAAITTTQSTAVQAIGAGNTLLPNGTGGWQIDSTDPDGVVGPLRARGVELDGRPVAVVGAGGAGRAAALGLRDAGAQVVLANRTVATGQKAAEELGVAFEPLAGFDPSAFRVIVNATALGHSDGDALPFDVERTDAAVVDMVYRATGCTDLIAAAQRTHGMAIDGREVLLHQALRQFRMMNGVDMDGATAARRLGAPWPGAQPSGERGPSARTEESR